MFKHLLFGLEQTLSSLQREGFRREHFRRALESFLRSLQRQREKHSLALRLLKQNRRPLEPHKGAFQSREANIKHKQERHGKIMARRKRTSPSIDGANTRANGLESIDAALDLGNSLTLAAFNAAIKGVEDQLDGYNQELSNLDAKLNTLQAAEIALDELSSRMLAATGVKFGKDSSQYEQAGGTRTSERKSPARKAKLTPEPVHA